MPDSSSAEHSEWLRLAVQTAGLLLSRTDPTSGGLTLSEEFAAWLGCERRITLDDAYSRVHPDDRDSVAARLNQSLDAGLTSQHRLRHVSGEYRWVSVRGSAVAGTADAPGGGFQWVTQDIHQQRLAEAELLLSARLLDEVTDAIVAISADHTVRYMNAAAEKRYATTLDAARGRPLSYLYTFAWVTPADEAAAYAALEQHGVWRGENRHVTRSGQEFWVESTVRMLRSERGEADGLIAVIRDIGERKELEQQRVANEMRIRLIADALPQLLWTAGDDGVVTYYNARAAAFEGLSRTTEGGWLWQPVVHPDDLAATTAAWRHAVATGESYQCEHRLRMRDGTTRWHISRAVRLESPSREWFGTATDVHDLKTAEQALREREALLRLAAEAARFGAYEYDPETDSLHWSDTLREIMGVPAGTDVSRTVALEFVHVADRARMPDLRSRGTATHAGVGRAEYRIVRPDGSMRWVADTWRATVADGHADRPCIVGTIQDVTEVKRTQLAILESERRFRIMADETPVIIWVTDATGRLQFVNRAYREYFGLPEDEVLGVEWQPFVHPDDAAYVEAFVAATAAHVPFAGETRVSRPDGQWRWIASRGTPRFAVDGEFLGFVGSSEDITDLRQAREAERESARQKDQFIAVLAHELRNPLAPIRAAVAILQGLDIDNPPVARCRDIIDRQSRHMSRLLDDLLDVSRLSRGQLTLQRRPMRLGEALANAIELARPSIDRRRHTLVLEAPDSPAIVDGDSARLTQVFGNLLTNAAKFTPEGGTIRVGVESRDRTVRVTISDTGIGIAPSMLESVFELFAQGSPTSGHADGLGIGLALARRLVALHGGTLTAASPGPGGGSTFVVTLALAPPTTPLPAPDAARRAGQASWQGRRVLVVDDNVDAADTLASFIRAGGGEPTPVYGGTAALEAAATGTFDVVLLDLSMPDLDGREVCRRLRAMDGARRAVVIAVTGRGREEDRQGTAEAGFDGHLVKPVDLEALSALVGSLRTES